MSNYHANSSHSSFILLLTLILAATAVDAQTPSFSAKFSPTAPESAKAAARAARAAGKIIVTEDVVDGKVTVKLPAFDPFQEHKLARISLLVVKQKNEKPDLYLQFQYYGAGWLFIEHADFKLGTNHVNLRRGREPDEKKFTKGLTPIRRPGKVDLNLTSGDGCRDGRDRPPAKSSGPPGRAA